MRFMLTVRIPTDRRNALGKDGRLGDLLQSILEDSPTRSQSDRAQVSYNLLQGKATPTRRRGDNALPSEARNMKGSPTPRALISVC
jgi:hypothetical protein